MTDSEARERVEAFTGRSVKDASLHMRHLKAICNALLDLNEAIDFLNKVIELADTEKETIVGEAFTKEFKRLKRNAQKLVREMQNTQLTPKTKRRSNNGTQTRSD